MFREYKFEKKLLQLNLPSEADESVFSEIFLDRDYLLVDSIIRKAASAIVDIGAHIGLFSMYARGLNEDVKVFAYEPEPKNFAALREHFKINRIENVFVKNVAVAGKDGEVVLHLAEDSHNHSLLQIRNSNISDGVRNSSESTYEIRKKSEIINSKFQINSINVPAVTMKTIFDRDLVKQGIDFVDLVKMDCEGAEFEILESMTPDLFKKIGCFYLEYHEYLEGHKKEDLIRIFQKNGFRTKVIASRYDRRLGFIWARR